MLFPSILRSSTSTVSSAFVLVGVLFLATTPTVDSVECGKWYSNECLGKDDIRYDTSYTNDLKDQAPIWGKLSGFWRYETRLRSGETGEQLDPVLFNPDIPIFAQGLPYQTSPVYNFVNWTIEGSRYYQHIIQIYAPPPAEFCEQPLPPGFSNVFGTGQCGVTGFSTITEEFATSTYEKDGGAIVLTSGDGSFGGNATDQRATAIPVDENTMFRSLRAIEGSLNARTFVCVDEDCNQMTGPGSLYFSGLLIASSLRLYERMESEEAYIAAVQAAYNAFNVTPEFRAEMPMTTSCLRSFVTAESCPTEEEFCITDPECSVGPYTEPEGSIRAGPITGFVVLFFVIIIGILFMLHRRKLAQQYERNRIKFAKRIAQTIKYNSGNTDRQLTPEALAEEFRRIDIDKGGDISKDELWQFMLTGKAGDISESDFNALFASIDVDNSGSVDFLEFCTFMGHCNEDFEKVKKRTSVLAARPSFVVSAGSRRDIAASTAHRLSSLAAVAELEGLDEDDDGEEEAKV